MFLIHIFLPLLKTFLYQYGFELRRKKSCLILATTSKPDIIDPCNPTPCGTNAVCSERNRAAACTCLPGLQGNPYIECKPECTINQECPSNLACMNQKCRDPCPGVCGVHATCSVNNHYPICQCDPGYEGDAFVRCTRKTTRKFQEEYFNNIFNFLTISRTRNFP